MMIIVLLIIAKFSEIFAFQPEFVENILNVSVAVGRDATFTCHVRHLGGYRVGWLKADTKAIQAIHENVITHNPRVTVSHLDQNTWNLHIKAVTEEDRGGYMCQLNTDPMKSQIGFLDVVIPPDFIAEDTSSDVIVPEGSSVKLTCRARGYPEPIVTWRREDGDEIVLKDNAGTKTLVLSFRGEVLKLTKISRNEMGSYLCIASNGVPPSVSKRISLSIHFHPVIQVPNQLVGAPLGTDVQIECHVEASPKSINYWIKDTGEMIVSSLKYHVQEFTKSMYETKMSMSVRNFQKDDVGSYRCIAKNSLGEVDSSIRLYEIPGPNRKNAANKHGGGGGVSADINDILKQKQLRVTYQPDDEDLYASAEDFDNDNDNNNDNDNDNDNNRDLALPPLTPNIYYTSASGQGNTIGHKQVTHKPGTIGLGSENGRHHYSAVSGVASVANGIGVNIGSGINGNLEYGTSLSDNGYNKAITRKPPFYGKTDIRSSTSGTDSGSNSGSGSGSVSVNNKDNSLDYSNNLSSAATITAITPKTVTSTTNVITMATAISFLFRHFCWCSYSPFHYHFQHENQKQKQNQNQYQSQSQSRYPITQSQSQSQSPLRSHIKTHACSFLCCIYCCYYWTWHFRWSTLIVLLTWHHLITPFS